MAGAPPAPYHRLRPADPGTGFPGGLEWLADLNPDDWRIGPHRRVNRVKVAAAAGLAWTTFHRQTSPGAPLTGATMSALKDLAMSQGVNELDAAENLIEFVPSCAARAATSSADLRQLADAA